MIESFSKKRVQHIKQRRDTDKEMVVPNKTS